MSPSKILRRNVAAAVFGGTVAFVAGERLVEAIRPALLLDPDPRWAPMKLVLWLTLLSATAASGALAAGLFLVWTGSRFAPGELAPLPFRATALALIGAGALFVGAVLRLAALDRIPPSLWIDDVSLIAPALGLHGDLTDFSNSVRPAPYGVPRPYGSVGVFYLELYRLALRYVGATVFGVRFLSAAAGIVSIVTATLLGRALLPRGGGALAALVLAGLRWHLLLSRWAWNAIVLAPVADIAALLLLRARRKRSLSAAFSAGLVAGLATHVYLAAWVAAAALAVLAVWPPERGSPPLPRVRLVLAFCIAFAVAVAPLFLLKSGRTSPYFARAANHSVLKEVGYTHSPRPIFGAVAGSLAAPWFGVDPFAHHDLPGKTRLGWILGIPVAVAFARSLLRPRDPFSAYLLAQGGAAFAASVAGGQAGLPDGYRFGYLTTATAVAAAGGVLGILAWVPPMRRRIAALAAVGLVSLSGALAARDALVRWPSLPETFDAFHGQDTLLARALIRWDRLGNVSLAPRLAHSRIAVEGIRRYRLDPDLPAPVASGDHSLREFRFVRPGAPGRPGERRVERVVDGWGREWAWVYGGRRKIN
jgi:Dolichyl-phosphate-mannose-protein mannosyltransferase